MVELPNILLYSSIAYVKRATDQIQRFVNITIFWALLEKYKFVSNILLHMNTLVLANQQKLKSALCEYWMLSWALTKSDDQDG